ncbi:MAG: hypothetical protein ACRDKY_09130 [Solirubrobacteraceae bacterium]
MSEAITRSGAPQHDGIDFTTLTITAVASGAAAYTCSQLWAPGTLASAAAMPVLVSIIKEALQRPAKVVTHAVPVRGVVRSATPRDADDLHAQPQPEPEPEPLTRVAQPGTLGDPPSGRSHRWYLAVITGLLGFLVAAVVLTVPELVAGGSASGGDRGTTLFGGDDERKAEKRDREREPTTTTPGRTVTVPGRTVTVPPPSSRTQTTTTPTQTVPPTTTAPVPGQP